MFNNSNDYNKMLNLTPTVVSTMVADHATSECNVLSQSDDSDGEEMPASVNTQSFMPLHMPL